VRVPRVFAHRGASRRAPDNSALAFRLARDLGADGVELDVRVSADDRLVVVHDGHFADGRPVAATASADRPADVLLLADALDECAGLVVNTELKNGPGEPGYDPDARVADLFVALIGSRDGLDQLLVSSFDPVAIARVRELDPAIATAQLTFGLDRPAVTVEAVAAAGHAALHPFDATVDGALVRDAHAAGLAVNVWTVDDPDRIQALVRLGVDGICTNVPDVAVGVIRRLAPPDR
jgi:glycerophosphoryl diester phosphodiesterase